MNSRMARISGVIVLWAVMMWPCTGRPWSDKGELSLSKAIAALEEGRLEDAVPYLEQSLQQTPESPQAHFVLGLTLNRLGRYSEALDHLQRARKIRPDLPGLEQELAQSLYHLDRNVEALEVLDEALRERALTGRLLYVRALVLIRLKRLKEARKDLEKAAELEPALRGICLYRAGALSYQLRDYPAARAHLQEVVKAEADATLVASSRRLLHRVEQEEGTGRYYVTASFGFYYDDNVVLEPDDVPVETLTGGDAEDGRFVFQGYGDYKFIKTPTWQFGVAGSVYNSNHLELHEYDLSGPKGILYGGYRWGPLLARLLYGYNYYWLDGDSYLRQHGGGPEIWWYQAPWAKLQVGYTYTDNDYFDLPGRDSFNHRGGLAQYFYWGQKAMLQLAYYVDSEHATGSDFDYLGHHFEVFGSVEMPWRMRAQGGVGYYARDYLHRHSFFGEHRDDRQWTLRFELARRITEHLDLSFSWVRVENGSNIDFFEYTRNILSLQIRAYF